MCLDITCIKSMQRKLKENLFENSKEKGVLNIIM